MSTVDVENKKKAWRIVSPIAGHRPGSCTFTKCRPWLLSFAAGAALSAYATAQTIPVPPTILPGRLPSGAMLLPDGWKISPAGAQIPVGGFPLRVVAIPHADLAISTSNGYSDHFLSLIDLHNHTILQRVPISDGSIGLAVMKDGKTVYASSGAGNGILVFHLEGLHLSPDGEIPLPVDTFPTGITLNADDSRLFIAGNLTNSMIVVDTVSRKVLFSGATGRKPYACALVQKEHAVYVSNWGEDNLSLLDMNDGHLIARLRVRDKPGDILSSPDGSRVFVTNGDRNIVSIIDTAKRQVVEEIDISLNRTMLPGSMPDGLALSPDGRSLLSPTPTITL
jgi:YVTN family beta-propeller protein